jgi:Rhodopirellula transposase DDE domain
VRSALDTNAYPAGLKVTNAEMETLQLKQDAFHGEWNYSLLPRQALLTAE